MARITQKTKNLFIYWIVVYLILLVRLISRRNALRFFGKLGAVAFFLIRSEREKTIRHLKLAFGNSKSEAEIYKLARQVFIYLGMNGADGLRLPILNRDNINRLVSIEGIEILEKVLNLGKGAMLVTGHIGCWELLAATLSLKGYPLYVVGKPIYDPRLDKIIVRNREGAGSKYIARGDSITKILRALRNNAMIGFLIDQDTDVDGVFVDFFGKPAYTPVGPVALALKKQVPVVPMVIQLMENYKHKIFVGEPIELVRTGDRKKDLTINTQKLSSFLEERIRLYPSQWVWMHERWKTQPGD